jgi:orotate phosphoribosyltransferase
MSALSKTQKCFIRTLHERGAIQIDLQRGFQLKRHEGDPHAPRSPVYINLASTSQNPTAGTMSPDNIRYLARRLYGRTEQLELAFDAVAGVPNRSTPIAEAISSLYGVPLVRLEKYENAAQREISDIEYRDTNTVPDGSSVLLVDDVIESGASKHEACAVLRAHNLRVHDIVVAIERRPGDGPSLFLEGTDIRVYSFVHIDEAIELLARDGRIPIDVGEQVLHQLQSET